MPNKRDPRHEARRVALAMLFERTFHSVDQNRSIERVLKIYEEEKVDRTLLDLIIKGVTENAEALDKIVAETAPAWPPDQITKADLITLRIAIFELVIAKNVPPKVAIDEAIELAKEFGGAASGSFINGVLGTVVKKHLEEGEVEKDESTGGKVKKILSSTLGVSKSELRKGASFSADLNIDPTELEEALNQVFGGLGVKEEKRSFETVGELIEFVKDSLDEIEE